jgi:PAS domain S-box-containing protein
MSDEPPAVGSRLVGHGDREQPTPLRVGCSLRSDRDQELVIDCLGSFDAVTVTTYPAESLATAPVDLYVIDQPALESVGQQLIDRHGPDDPVPCLLVTESWETVLAGESTAIPESLQPLVTDVIAPPLQEPELRRRLHVLVKMRRQSKRLAHSMAHHQELLELLPEAVLLVTGDTIRYANTAAESLLGADESALLDRPFEEFVAGADRSTVTELLETTRRSQTAEFVSFELDIDGETVTIEAAGTAVGLDGDTVELVCRDQTGRKQREARLELYETVMDEATVGITITDARETDNPLIYANDEFKRLTGVDHEWMLGRNPRFAQTERTDPDTVAEIREAVDNGEAISVELLNQRADGTEWHNALDIFPIYQDGELTHFLGFQRDVTASHTQRNQLAVLDRVLRHNLRNRLNVVLGHAETLANGNSTEAVPLHASTICETAEELLALSEKTRRFRTAVETDSKTAKARDLAPILENCLATISEEYPGATISCDIPERVDVQSSGVIRFALSELLSNAVDHSDQNEPYVDVSVTETATGVRVRIADDGPGIPKDEQQAFTDTTETPTDHAIGMGLWLVRWAIDSAGGELDYEEADPRGSIVTVRLPSNGSP